MSNSIFCKIQNFYCCIFHWKRWLYHKPKYLLIICHSQKTHIHSTLLDDILKVYLILTYVISIWQISKALFSISEGLHQLGLHPHSNLTFFCLHIAHLTYILTSSRESVSLHFNTENLIIDISVNSIWIWFAGASLVGGLGGL